MIPRLYRIVVDEGLRDLFIVLLISYLFQDQVDVVASHTQKGIENLEKYGMFLKERAAIEDEYAAKLRCPLSRYSFLLPDTVPFPVPFTS